MAKSSTNVSHTIQPGVEQPFILTFHVAGAASGGTAHCSVSVGLMSTSKSWAIAPLRTQEKKERY